MTSSLVSAQDVTWIPCNFCEDSKEAVWFCRQCAKHLCDYCKRIHANIPQCENHTVVSILEGPGIDLDISTTCKDHKSQLDLFCKTCDLKICVICVTGTHRKHDFSLLTDYVKSRKETFDEVCSKKNEDVLSIKEEIKKLESHLSKYKDEMRDCRMKIQKVAKDKISKVEEMKRKLDKGLDSKEQENVEKMVSYLVELKKLEEDHQKLLQSVRNHRLETVPSAFLDFIRNSEKEISSLNVDIKMEIPFADQFVCNKTDTLHLGSLTQIKSEMRTVSIGPNTTQVAEVPHQLKSKDDTPDDEKQVPSLSSDLQLVASVSDEELLDHAVHNMDIIDDDRVWISLLTDQSLMLEKYKVKKTVKLPCTPFYTTVLTSGELLVSCGTVIQQVSLEGVVSEFTDLSPLCKKVYTLAATHQNEVFACLLNNKEQMVVVKVSREGKKILELDSRMFAPNQSSVSVALDGTYFIRDNEQLVFINHIGDFVKNVKRTGEMSNVREIVVDRFGRIIGCTNDQLFVFGPDGTHIQTYNISCYKARIYSTVFSLKIDTQDNLWVGLFEKVIVLKYLQ